MMLRALFAAAVLALSPVVALATPAAPVAGVDYVAIEGGKPFAPVAGKIEVAEVFGYTCPHCASFEPALKAWARRQPADVKLTPVPAAFGGYWVPYARAFFAAERLGALGKTHQAVFDALHVQRSLPVQNVSVDELADFYARYGVDRARFVQALRGPEVDARIKASLEFLARAEVESTPTLIVAGKYKVIGGRTHEEALQITSWLVAQERARLRQAAKGK